MAVSNRGVYKGFHARDELIFAIEVGFHGVRIVVGGLKGLQDLRAGVRQRVAGACSAERYEVVRAFFCTDGEF